MATTITAATPNFYASVGTCAITFTGTNIPTGAVPDLVAILRTPAGVPVDGLVATPATTSDPTTLTADLYFPGGTQPGTYSISISSKSLGLNPAGVPFIVRPTPVIRGYSPTSSSNFGPLPVVLIGTDFPNALEGDSPSSCTVLIFKVVGTTWTRVGGSTPTGSRNGTLIVSSVTIDPGTPVGDYVLCLDVDGYGKGAAGGQATTYGGPYTIPDLTRTMRVTQAVVEVLSTPPTLTAVMTQAAVEVIGPGRPLARVTQAILETLTSQTTTVPNLVGLSVTAATAALTAADLVLGDVVQVFHPTMPDNDVISQVPVAGTVVGKTSAVAVLVSEGVAPPAFLFKIAGTDRTHWVRANGSFRVESQLGARTRAELEVRDYDSFQTAYRPKLDDRLDIVAPPTLFTGVLTAVNDGPLGAPGVGTVTKAGAMDDWRLAAKRLVTKTYPAGTTLAIIATDLVTSYLKPYGIKLEPFLPGGPILADPFTSDLETIEAVFNRLALLTGWVYRLTPQNLVQWFAIGSKTRGIVFSAANKNILGEVTWGQSQGDYINRVILRYGSGTPTETDSFIGDGTTRSFKLTYPLAVAGWVSYPAVALDQQPKSQRGTTTPGAARPGLGVAQPNKLEYYPSDFPALATYQSTWPNLVYLTPPGGSNHFPAGWGPGQQPAAANSWWWDYNLHALVHDQTFPYDPNSPAKGNITPKTTTVGFGPYLALKKEGVGVGFHWHYDAATNSLVSDYPFAPPAGIAFTFEYTANYPLTITVEDAADIAAHGIAEAVYDAPEIFGLAEATAHAKSLLKAGGQTPRTVLLTTRTTPGYLPGDTVTLDVPARTLPTSQWLVTATAVILADDQTMTTTLTLLEGTQVQASWIDFWRQQLGGVSAGSGTTQPGSSSVSGLLLGDEDVVDGITQTTPAVVTMVPPHTPGRLVKWGTETNTITDVLDSDPYGITALTGDVRTGVGGGPQEALIQPGVVTNLKLRDSAPLSVIGRAPGGTAGPPADIAALAGTGYPLREEAGRLGFGTLSGAVLKDGSVTNDKLATPGTGGGSGGGMNLDYLGPYATGPTYNDGDIVIGADGIAYLCVVDGTTTPPEPWPGSGIAINAGVDASYWVVSGHAALTNERVMSALANGYVKSTGGEPTTLAIIPVTDGGTGASTAANARVNLGIGTVGPINLNGNVNTFLTGTGTWAAPPVGVVSGSIIFFATPCPPGYTRLAAWDGYFVRMGNANVSGGAATHTHGIGTYAMPAHTHGVGTFAAANHNHGPGSFGVASHSHGISGQTSTASDHQHSFAGSTGGESAGSFTADAGGDGQVPRAPHTHSFSGSTGAGGGHAHNLPGSTDNAAPGLTGNSQSTAPAVTGVSASTGPVAITGASDAQSNNPLYVDLFACRKD